ncbi:MAG: NUDIX domain-containing protein [Bacteroidetes bacterium]|nr:NUDIX domain-containing protein [Bacteroidota bacterium]
MTVKIYKEDQLILLTDNKEVVSEQYKHHPGVFWIDFRLTDKMEDLLQQISQSGITVAVLYSSDLATLKALFFASFSLIQAAGGLVENERGEQLIIYRCGKWDLPKGKIDEGETPSQCAVREVEEETGLKQIQLQQPLTTTYHIYSEKGQAILKETFWFKMKVTGEQVLSPQAEEDIEAVKWILPSAWSEYAKETYPSIREVMGD